MVERVTVAHGGEMTSQEMPSSKGTQSSEDYNSGGLEVRSGPLGFKQNVHDIDQLSDTDMITHQGMEISVGQAKALGLLEGMFANAPKPPAAGQSPAKAGEQKSDTGHQGYDEQIDGLNMALEDGIIDFDEAREYDTAGGELALSGFTAETAWETLHRISNDPVAESEVPADQRAALKSVQEQVTNAATKSAQRELGEAGFQQLSDLANMHEGVQQTLWLYATDRAMGRTSVTWSELAADLRSQLGMK